MSDERKGESVREKGRKGERAGEKLWARPAYFRPSDLYLLSFLGVAWLTAVVYGQSLTLPFFFDDLDHLPYVAQTSLPAMWQSAGGFPYFRPLGATVWRLSYLLWGEHNPVWLHALNLFLHGLNGWLVGWLAWRGFDKLKQRWVGNVVAVLAATFFILFPFSYQAVPWVGALYHLLVTTLVLTAVVSFQQWQTSRHPFWLTLTLLTILLAPFAHENGIMAAPLVALYQLVTQSVGQPAKWKLPLLLAPRTLLWFTPLLIWLPIWWLAPKARDTAVMSLNQLETIGQNGAYFAQGLAFPLSWLGGWMRDSWGWNDLGVSLLLSLLALGVVLGTAVGLRPTQPPRSLWLGLPLAWWLLTSLPAILLLDFAYVISAPRLLMLPSVGAALLWANVAGIWLTHAFGYANKRGRQAALLGVALLAGLAILPASWFIHDHLRQHAQLGQVWWQLTEEITAAGEAGQTSVVLNFPGSLTRPHTFYPLGHEGTVFNVSYIPPERIYEVNSGQALAEPVRFRRYDDIRPEYVYLYGVLDEGVDWPVYLAEEKDTAVFNTRYHDEQIWLEQVGSWTAQPSAPETSLAHFPELDLWLIAGESTPTNEPHQVQVTLDWYAPAPLGYEWSTFVHLLDKQTGALVAQADGHALGNTFPMGQWSPGLAVQDVRRIPLPAGIDPANLTTAVGLYHWQTGERLEAVMGDVRGTAVSLELPLMPRVNALPTVLPTAVAPPSTPLPPATPTSQPTATSSPPTTTPTPITPALSSQAIGFSHDGHPIISYQIGTGETHVMFVGGMHGGYEWNTILLAYEALDYFLTQPQLVPPHVTLHIIPSANPDGQKLVTGSTGRFDPSDVIFNTEPGRFNGRGVDLNRNWACDWQPTAQWRDQMVSGGTAAFSEPETRALRDYILAHDPTAVVFWHSAANAIFSAYCPDQHLPSDQLAELYGAASGYPVRYTFSAYPITGDASNWLTTQGIASITIELTTHSTIEWEANRRGITAVLLSMSDE